MTDNDSAKSNLSPIMEFHHLWVFIFEIDLITDEDITVNFDTS